MTDFTLLVFEGAFASTISMSRDILTSAETMALRAGSSKPTWRICSAQGGSVNLQGGFSVETRKLPSSSKKDCSTWVLPGLALRSPEEIEQRLAQEDVLKAIKQIKRHVNAGGKIAAACSAVFLLEAAGVLDEKNVTTTWWLAPYLQVKCPTCKVNADRMIQVDGTITTAGAAFAQSDLMIHLLRTQFGSKLADLTSRVLLISGRKAQADFIVPEMLARGDNLVQLIIARVEAALPNPPSVIELADELGMSEKTLARHIQKATGKSTLALIQSVKLRRAKCLLEQTRMTVEQISEAVGYADSTAFRRLMKKVYGVGPGSLREKIHAQYTS